MYKIKRRSNDSKDRASDINYRHEENNDINMYGHNSNNNNKHVFNKKGSHNGTPTATAANSNDPDWGNDKNGVNLDLSHHPNSFNKMKKYKNKKHKSLNPNYMDTTNTGKNTYLESYVIKGKNKINTLNNNIIKNSHIELNNKLNPALTLVASKAVNGLLDGVHKHMQGPFALSSNPNGNSPLAPQIFTPNLYPNMPNPFNLNNGMPQPTAPPMPMPAPSPQSPPPQAIPNQPQPVPNTPPSNVAAVPGQVNPPPTMPMPATQLPYQQSDNLPNLMAANQIAQNPAFNIHPTATNLRDNPGNVNYNEVVTITIGIVICLFLFCFIFGCLAKMCKPAKRRR
ncbi:conserved Plasmodium protein, unknown function [Plasmodium chabaudi adami]|uniref:Uncharacterized protein n=1 Tax=Plasmodium chabaudi adami TaxID=5826 RepID=A0A1C6YC53_PLACE|nr:conserved Plasmodium protein, unknown function [Plasmodium chabaudi adami]